MPYFPNSTVLGAKHQKECPGAQARQVVCIDQYGEFNFNFIFNYLNFICPTWTWSSYHLILIGRQHQKQVLFCDCENDTVTIIRLKLWPGSVTRPVLAFHLKLMELAEIFLLECHVSLRKFCDAIGIYTKSSTLPLLVSTVVCMYGT